MGDDKRDALLLKSAAAGREGTNNKRLTTMYITCKP